MKEKGGIPLLKRMMIMLALGVALGTLSGVEAKSAAHPKVLLAPTKVETITQETSVAQVTPAVTNTEVKEEVKKENETQKPAFEDKRIEINLASKLLTLYQGDVGIRMYPIAPGKPSSPTPLGRRKVEDMEINPTWIDPDSDTKIPSGPDCPLGYRWIGIGGNYGIHGTNVASSIGTYASHGCVRMNEADVEDLFAHIVKGIPVDIIYERLVVEQAPDKTVIYYVYPDGYGRENLDVSDVKKRLSAFGVAGFADPDEVQHALAMADGDPNYVAKVYDLYLKGEKLKLHAYGKDGHIYLPAMALARAAGIQAEWSPNWKRISTAYGVANGLELGSAIYIDASDAPALFHLTGHLNEKLDYELQ